MQMLEGDRYRVVKTPDPALFRLCTTSIDGDVEEEVFRVHGIVCGKDLPPLPMNVTKLAKKRLFLRQSIRLTGLDDMHFARAVEQVEEGFVKISMDAEGREMDAYDWSNFNGRRILEASTRYFTHKSQAGGGSSVPFAEEVDPHGTLRALTMDGDFLHLQENDVIYSERFIDTDKSIKRVSPSAFDVGDLVEASVAFVGVPTKRGSVTMKLVLRGLVLLDRQERMKGSVLRMRSRFTAPAPTATAVKRKALFEDGEVEDTRRKLEKTFI
ncbi:hypothetical protein DFP72DRAFT_817675 [Ephemerocybe angulata]|uniref:Uncharacterized protein n=1 Tax=Ephemerocybe angulata TaxID=980116 RepID=A0A8H6HPP3_9AGAR|nr:hypothetical protein DFP72DRAFT_830888 [Tulosesus angulatus]KAF6750464.1 hypothetical protein DFP72DRAFT_817675 [Tulosesus angulatus]